MTRDLGVYVHWPFCQAKCPYCDFNSHVASFIDQERWRGAYREAISRIASQVPDYRVRSIFFGGGTPSLMEAETVGSVLHDLKAAWPWANDVEITLEANPNSVEANRFRAFRDCGVNRISIGIQSLDDGDLKRLGRLHTVDEALTAYDVARSTFDRVSFDLIYARQNQSLQDWQAELRQALDLAPSHLSLYQLTIETGTAFGDRYRRGALRGLPDEDLAADLYEATQQMCEDAGYPAYEISNHARPGEESRHNLIYWTGQDYVGIGPGAHGRVTTQGTRYETDSVSTPGLWLKRLDAERSVDRWTPQTPRMMAEERAFMGLRLRDGVPVAELASIPDLDTKLAQLRDLELADVSNGRLTLSDAGRPLLNGVVRTLLA